MEKRKKKNSKKQVGYKSTWGDYDSKRQPSVIRMERRRITLPQKVKGKKSILDIPGKKKKLQPSCVLITLRKEKQIMR